MRRAIAWLKSRAASKAASPGRILVVTKLPIEEQDGSGIVHRTWSESLPNFTEFVAVAAEVPTSSSAGAADLEELLVELGFAAKGGALTIWLVSEESDPAYLSKVIGLEHLRLREASPGSTLESLEPRLLGVIKTIQSYRVVFKPGDDWVPLASVPTGGVSPVLGRRDPKSRLITALLVPFGPHSREVSLRALSDWAAAELRHRSEAERGRRALRALCASLVVFSGMLTAARYSQKSENLHIRERGERFSPISDYRLSSLGPLPYGQETRNWPDELLRAPAAATADRRTLLSIAASVGDFRRENALVEFLLGPDGGATGPDQVASHISQIYRDLVSQALTQSDFERARFLAQRFLNIGGRLPYTTGFHLRSRGAMNQMRRVVDLTAPNYLYHDAADAATLGMVALEGGSASTYDLPDPQRIDPTLVDNVRYSSIVLTDGPRDWGAFVGQFVSSEKRDAAAFNAVNASFEDPTETLRLSRDFVAAFPSSYLADDALFYVVRLSIEGGDFPAASEAFGLLARNYPRSDSLKRLQYLLLTKGTWDSEAVALGEVARSTRGAAAGADSSEFLKRALEGLRGVEWNE